MPEQVITLEGHVSHEQEKTYLHLPFEMPAGATRLEVHYEYSHRISAEPSATGGTTIDLGVFDSRGIDFLKAGFRGWSGSERSRFYITATEATPGYLAGALLPGRWHLLLGLYKVAPEGSSYRVDITINTGVADQPRANLPAAVASLPASPLRSPLAGWVRGELHCHTLHSDGEASPEELVHLARARGLNFLAITDHNTTSTHAALAHLSDPELVLIRGFEVTTFKGHFNVWGTGDWVDFRVQDQGQMHTALLKANGSGTLTSCNHPGPAGSPWEYQSEEGFQCIEVWNGPWERGNQASLDFWLARLAEGRRIPAVGGSDYHRHADREQGQSRELGVPTTWVRVDEPVTEAAILHAIGQGHVSLSASPEGAFVELRAGAGLSALQGDSLRMSGDKLEVQVSCYRSDGHLRLLDQQGTRWEQRVDGGRVFLVHLPVPESLYLRAELRSRAGEMLALTNPIYLER